MPALEQHGDDVWIRVRLQPRASQNNLSVSGQDCYRVTLTAPPVDGKANQALCAFLAARLDMPKTRLALVRGLKSRDKVVCVSTVRAEAVSACLGQP